MKHIAILFACIVAIFAKPAPHYGTGCGPSPCPPPQPPPMPPITTGCGQWGPSPCPPPQPPIGTGCGPWGPSPCPPPQPQSGTGCGPWGSAPCPPPQPPPMPAIGTGCGPSGLTPCPSYNARPILSTVPKHIPIYGTNQGGNMGQYQLTGREQWTAEGYQQQNGQYGHMFLPNGNMSPQQPWSGYQPQIGGMPMQGSFTFSSNGNLVQPQY